MLQARRPRIRATMKSLNYFNLPSPSSHTMALGFTLPLTEMSIKIRKVMFLGVE
jgi:hypothetical protein